MDSTQSQSATEFVSHRRSSILAAIFLMATSAIGPGFITQTATFTATMGSAFAFGILASIVIDFVVQQNIWRIVTLSNKTAADVANAAIPGSGYLLAIFVIFGGLVFNIGNIAGAGLGLNALLGLDPKWGGLISALVAVGIFASRNAGIAIDRLLLVLGLVMIVLTCYVMVVSAPPYGEALKQSVLPSQISFATITTIVGGTVGGYIAYAGAHRLLDKGAVGAEHASEVSRAATQGIVVVGLMRYILFLAILGVVASGVTLDISGQSANPAAQAFSYITGDIGLHIFGLILWAAGISSVIGAAYTSVSFMGSFTRHWNDTIRRRTTVVFILFSLVIFLSLGTAPTAMLVFAGGFNGLILPLGLTVFVYIGACRRDLLGNYPYPKWLVVSGALICLVTWYMGLKSVSSIFHFLTIQ